MNMLMSIALAVFLLYCKPSYGIPLEDFYPFGVNAGDNVLERTLDGSSPLIDLTPVVFPFHGQEYTQLFVNANGHISFLTAVASFTPEPFPLAQSLPLIAPFWADSDTRPVDGGFIWYRNSTDSEIIASVEMIIQDNFLRVNSFSPSFLFIVTWDHVGYYDRNTDRTNTFQCVMATDGEISFVLYLYADGLIQWLWSEDHEEIPAEVGVNVGDGTRFFRHPDSNTLDLINITFTSNIDKPGVWVIRTDREGAPSRGCRKDLNVPLTLIPRSSNMLGGTVVIISGPCFSVSKKVTCTFDNNVVDGVVVSDSFALCTTPEMHRAGSVPLVVEHDKSTYKATFISISPERAYALDLVPGGLLFTGGDERTIRWSPGSILSPQVAPSVRPEEITVDIKLFHQELVPSSLDQYQWIEVATLNESLSNSGEASVVIPPIDITCRYPIAYDNIDLSVCPVIFEVTVNSLPDNAEETISDYIPGANIGQWSGVAFLRAANTTDMELRNTCERWSNADAQASRLSQLRACPPTIRLARFDLAYQQAQLVSSFARGSRYEEDAMRLFHPDSHVCYIEAVPQSMAGQECCYNIDGNLIVGAPGGGSADARSPRSDFNGHLRMDLAPYLLCCTGGSPNCAEYFSARPGGREISYILPIPACIYGDPHIVTLDGLKYTFNGKGEFILIETEDGSFTMQGRMEPAKTADNQNALGTVFTAIVAIQHETNTSVQFEIRTQGVKVRVDGEFIDFDEMTEIKLEDVTVEDRGNATVMAAFSKGTSIELKVENGIISVMLVSLPPNQKGKTSGLMGNFNGDPNDDLLPRGAQSPIPSDSSMEDIHHLFGMTWLIDNEINSSFVYNPGDSHLTFFDRLFVPTFEPDFGNNTELEKAAKEICGDDTFCLFDIATTKRTEIGATTLVDSVNFEDIMNSSKPILCDPQCVNGACVDGNTCVCSEGFTGNRCEIPIMSPCDETFCENNGTCIKHVLTVMCECPPGFIGSFCQDREPQFHIRLINSSPRVAQNKLIVDFTPSKPIKQAKCFLTGQYESNCTSGHVTYDNIPSATYIFRVVARTHGGERAVTRRIVHILGEEGSGDDIICAVNLINDGIVVNGKSATAHFVTIGTATSHLCRLDTQVFTKCRSPIKYQNLSVGSHRIQIQPQGDGCSRKSRLTAKFFITEG